MDKLTAIKIKYKDGTYSDEIPVSVLSENVEWDSTHTLVDILGNIDVDVTGTIQDQISQLFNEKVNSSEMQSYVSNNINTYITNWLNTNVNPVGSAVVVDSSLTVSGAAADAKVVGDKVAGLDDLEDDLDNLKSALTSLNVNSEAFYEKGGLQAGGDNANDNRTIRFKTWHKYPDRVTVIPKSGYKFCVYEDKNGGYPSTGWLEDIYTIEPGIPFRIIFRRTDDSTEITTAEYVGIDIFTDLSEFQNLNDEKNYVNFVLGTIYNGNVDTRINYRFATENILYSTQPVIIWTDQLETRFAVMTYESVNGMLLNNSGWEYGYYYVPSMTPFRIMVARIVNTVIDDLESDTLYKELHITGLNTAESLFPLFESVSHRGFLDVAPENTIPAFALSKKMGFKWIETDVSWTSDGIPVILHDSTIDRTSNGSGTVTQMTFSELRTFDFGSWKNPIYTGTIIPSVHDALKFCKMHGLNMFLEIKFGATQERINALIEIVKSYGMVDHVFFFASGDNLSYLRASSADGINVCVNGVPTAGNISYVAPFKNFANRIAFGMFSGDITQEHINALIENGYELLEDISNTSYSTMNDYASFVLTNSKPYEIKQ